MDGIEPRRPGLTYRRNKYTRMDGEQDITGDKLSLNGEGMTKYKCGNGGATLSINEGVKTKYKGRRGLN